MTDPFAPPVSDEPTLATNSTNSPWDNEPKTPVAAALTAIPALNLTGSQPESKVTLTFKGGAGFDAPWIVIHAADLEDAHRQVTEEAVLLASLMSQVAKAGSHFASNGPVNTGRGGNTSGASAPPQGATEAPSWAPPKHEADAVYKSGISNSGFTWHAWMAPTKGDYEPLFFKNPKK